MVSLLLSYADRGKRKVRSRSKTIGHAHRTSRECALYHGHASAISRHGHDRHDPPKQHYRHQPGRNGRQPALFLSPIPRPGDAQRARRPVRRGVQLPAENDVSTTGFRHALNRLDARSDKTVATIDLTLRNAQLEIKKPCKELHGRIDAVGSQKRCLWPPRQIKDLDIFFEKSTCLSSQKRCPWPRDFSEKSSLGMSRPRLDVSTELSDKQRHGRAFQRPAQSTLLVL